MTDAQHESILFRLEQLEAKLSSLQSRVFTLENQPKNQPLLFSKEDEEWIIEGLRKAVRDGYPIKPEPQEITVTYNDQLPIQPEASESV